MKKILLVTLGLLLAISVVPQMARGGVLPEGFGANQMDAILALREPCRRIYLQLKKFDTCPAGRECIEVSGATVDKFHMDNGDSICVIRKGDNQGGRFVGTLNGLVGENVLVALTAMSQLDDGDYTFYYGINNMEEFLNYNGYALSLAGGAGNHYIVFKDVVDATQVAEIEGGGQIPHQEDLIDALNRANGGAAAGDDGFHVVPGGLLPGGKVIDIPGAKKPRQNVVGKLPFKPFSDKAVKRFAVGNEPEVVVEPDAAVGDPDVSASGGNDAPVADLEATEVNPNTNTLCSLNTNLVPNLSSLAYVGFAFIGMVLAGIRRRIRSRRDR